MKKNAYLIVLIMLLLVAAYIYFTRSTSTISSEYSDFSIEDTSKVDKIFIADYEGGSAELSRKKDNSWTINEKYKARKDAVDLLLSTFKQIKVKEPVAKAAVENIIREMAAKSIKVEIYEGGKKPSKIYYVGNPTQNHFGTFMILEVDGEKSSIPYVTHIPGMHGFLTPRFFTDMNLWRDRTIFNFSNEDIKSVQLSYLEKPTMSFRLMNDNDDTKVLELSTGNAVEPLKNESIGEYLSRYKSIHYEYIAEASDFVNIDSVTSTLPLHIIEVEQTTGEKTTLKTYYKPVKGSDVINPATGQFYTYDLDRLYAWINDTDFVVMQWPTLDKILAYSIDFKKSENVDN